MVARKKITTEFLIDFINNKGYAFKELEFNGCSKAKSKITFECNNGHVSTRRYDSMKDKGEICTACSKKSKKLEVEDSLKKFIKTFGYNLIETFYDIQDNGNKYKMIRIECKNKHEKTLHCKTDINIRECRECILEIAKSTNKLHCPGCLDDLPIDNFNNCESNTHRLEKDHYCKKCRFFQHSEVNTIYDHLTFEKLEYKKCSKCVCWKILDFFSNDKKLQDKLKPFCKTCEKVMEKNCEPSLKEFKLATKDKNMKF